MGQPRTSELMSSDAQVRILSLSDFFFCPFSGTILTRPTRIVMRFSFSFYFLFACGFIIESSQYSTASILIFRCTLPYPSVFRPGARDKVSPHLMPLSVTNMLMSAKNRRDVDNLGLANTVMVRKYEQEQLDLPFPCRPCLAEKAHAGPVPPPSTN